MPKTPIRIAINGFGRIGRMTLRILQQRPDVEVVAVNDLADPVTLAHLFRYDSVHGRYAGRVEAAQEELRIDGQSIRVLNEKNPAALPWAALQVDLVLECTGHFLTAEGAQQHLAAGARKVLLSAPPKGEGVKTVVLGVNDHLLEASDVVLSNASCTTNNAAPMLYLLDERWGIESAFVTTVHSYTGDQHLHDAPHRDLRRARAAAVSIIPTTTGAAKALGDVFPHLNGKLGGAGIRVPVPDGSLTDITCELRDSVTVEAVNGLFREASAGRLKGILEYCSDPIVSADIVGNTHSCIFDSLLTTVVGNMIKVVGWYDNEMGYSNRLAELAVKMFS
jgi:glyceraldehyde 3-phosphate dehydrogenase